MGETNHGEPKTYESELEMRKELFGKKMERFAQIIEKASVYLGKEQLASDVDQMLPGYYEGEGGAGEYHQGTEAYEKFAMRVSNIKRRAEQHHSPTAELWQGIEDIINFIEKGGEDEEFDQLISSCEATLAKPLM